MTFEQFKNEVKEKYGSINKYCIENETLLNEAGISRATFYGMFNGRIKNPTKDNLIAFAQISTIPLEEVINVFIIGHRDSGSGD
jgi:hypothetical protein